MRTVHVACFAALVWAVGCHKLAPPPEGGEPPAIATTAQPASSSAAPPTPSTAAPSAAPAPSSPAVPSEKVDLPAPGRDWRPAPPQRAFGYVSVYFGTGEVKDPGALRPLAAYARGDEGAIRVFRRIDPQTGTPLEIDPLTGSSSGPLPKKMKGSRALWYEWQSDGVQFYWLTLGSLVLEAEDRPLARGPALAAVFRPWALKVATEHETPQPAP